MATEQELRTALYSGLARRRVIVELDDDYHENIFKNDKLDEEIWDFIETSELYDGKRWRGIPRVSNDAKELYEPFSIIFEEIFKHFKYPEQGRVFLDTHNVEILSMDGSLTMPSFMVIGMGTNFPVTKAEDIAPSIVPCYRRCASPGYIKTENSTRYTMDTIQLAIYARQCFLEQPNRKFVYAILLTEQNMRIFMFDRSGVLQSGSFDIHLDPEIFVRIVLGFCSPDDERIGFDTSIVWVKNNDENCHFEAIEFSGEEQPEHESAMMKKTERDPTAQQVEIEDRYDQHIYLDNHWGKTGLGKKVYLAQSFLFARYTLRGRGTRCWAAVEIHPNSTEKAVLVKDSWRSSGSDSEAKLLAEVAGLPGVAQMVAYQDDGTDTTARFRYVPDVDMTDSRRHDRTFSRIILEKYGDPLEYFKDSLHLLCAFRDAVRGHQNLWTKRNILHRDVSLNNILHASEGALEGYKGILIDLDRATRIDDLTMLADTPRTGTHKFQSINVLLSETFGESARYHDYLDDLESFFYCLATICCAYVLPDELGERPEAIVAWDNIRVKDAASAKLRFLGNPDSELTPYFEPLAPTFRSMGTFLLKHALRKQDASLSDLEKIKLEDMKEESREHYNTFLGYIDDAIDLLSPPTSDVVNPPPTPSLLPSPPNQSLTELLPHTQDQADASELSRKRRADDLEECELRQKKRRVSASLVPVEQP